MAAIALLAAWFQHTAMNTTSRQLMVSLEGFYNKKIIQLEQDWQEMAFKFHNRLELHNLFNDPDTQWQRLQHELDQEITNQFSLILVIDSDQRILFKQSTTPITLPERFDTTKSINWFKNSATGILYRWFSQPLWLGSLGNGELILFIPIENSLLFHISLPYTDLFLIEQNQITASSLGVTSLSVEQLRDSTYWQGKSRFDQISLPWGKPDNLAPQLVIRHHSTPIFSATDILLAGISIFSLLSVLFWGTLGIWLLRLTRRITILSWVAQEFSKGYHLTLAIRHALNTARHTGHDEVTDVANAMEHATELVEHELLARQQAQASLQKISSHNQLLLNAAGEGIFGLDDSGRTTFINPAGALMLGWEPEDLTGKIIHDIMHHTNPDNTPHTQENCLIYAAIQMRETQHVTNELFWRKDNTSFPVEYTSTPIFDNHTILGAVVVFRDISARIQAEKQALHYLTYQRIVNGLYEISYFKIPLQEQLEQALDFIFSVPWLAIQAQGAVFLANSTTQTLQLVAHKGLNNELLTLCQYVPYGHCLCGRAATAKAIIHANCIDERHDILFEGMAPHGHYSVPILSGEQLLGVLTLYLQSGQARNQEEESLLQAVGNTLGSMIERKKLEESLHNQNLFLEDKVLERTAELQDHIAFLQTAQNQLIQSERMAALGGLVAGISHEIKTPVGIGYTAVTYLESETVKLLAAYEQKNLQKETFDQYLENATEATQLIKVNLKRASDLILSFKNVAVDQTSQEKRRFNLKEYLEEILFTLHPKIKKTQHQVIITCPESIELFSHPGALSQIVANLILNSLTYAFENHESGEIRINAGITPDTHVFIHYQDNGKGMDKETQKKIYEPFFTTNRNQGGSGLGMHIVYNLVTQRLNGTIQCISAPEHGTQFQIQFPQEQ